MVERHDREFTEDDPKRPAGSQAEGLAATYLLGHLQQAGYLVRLDNVPVEDLIRSSNVMALPPDGGDASVMVAVAYDTPPGETTGGEAIGTWLEVARALRVVEPEHSVGFVGLGADNSDIEPGRLGSRRLARFLLDEGVDPEIILIEEAPTGEPVTLKGELAPDLAGAADSVGVDATIAPGDVEVFQDAGFSGVEIRGNAISVGRTLLEFLT